jgi:D-sedoheptulose 7-phosphate isomerase
MFESGVRDSISTREGLLDTTDEQVSVILKLSDILRSGGQILIFGNGGSAADAQHIATELVGRFYLNRRPLPVLPLTVNTSALTAIGNDFEFADVFSRQVAAYGRPGDAAIGISTSGNAANVISGVREARRIGMWTIGMTGRGGGELAGEVDCPIRVPSDETARIQESHILIGHLWCQGIEDLLFGEDAAEE